MGFPRWNLVGFWGETSSRVSDSQEGRPKMRVYVQTCHLKLTSVTLDLYTMSDNAQIRLDIHEYVPKHTSI